MNMIREWKVGEAVVVLGDIAGKRITRQGKKS